MFKSTRWVERDKPEHWERWRLQFQLEEECERIWNQGIWLPQILMDLDQIQIHLLLRYINKGFGFGPSNPNPKDPNRMPTNRFSDLPKNINDEGWKEETVKEKNLLHIKCNAREKKNCMFFLFLVLYVNPTNR